MLEKSSPCLPLEQTWESKSLDVDLNIAGVKKKICSQKLRLRSIRRIRVLKKKKKKKARQ